MFKKIWAVFFPPADDNVVQFDKAMNSFIAAHLNYQVMKREALAAYEKVSIEVYREVAEIEKKRVDPRPFWEGLTFDIVLETFLDGGKNVELGELTYSWNAYALAAAAADSFTDEAIDRLNVLVSGNANRYPWMVAKTNAAVSLQHRWRRAMDGVTLNSDGTLCLEEPTVTPHDLAKELKRSVNEMHKEVNVLRGKCIDFAKSVMSSMS